jgi:hypothetical protein
MGWKNLREDIEAEFAEVDRLGQERGRALEDRLSIRQPEPPTEGGKRKPPPSTSRAGKDRPRVDPRLRRRVKEVQ